MLYNKSKYRKVNDKKVLHKIGKRWVTLSIAMLALLGGGAAASHVTHAASTTPAAKPAVNKPANNVSSAKAKLVKLQSVSSSAKGQSVSASSSTVSGKSTNSVSTSVASKSTSSVASTKSSANNSKQATSASSVKASASVFSNNQSKSARTNTSRTMSLGLSVSTPISKNVGEQMSTDDVMNLFKTNNLVNIANVAKNNPNVFDAYNNLMTFAKNIRSFSTGKKGQVWFSTFDNLNGYLTTIYNAFPKKNSAYSTTSEALNKLQNDLTNIDKQLNYFNSFGGFFAKKIANVKKTTYSLNQLANKLDDYGIGTFMIPVLNGINDVVNNTHANEAYLDAVNQLTELPSENYLQQANTIFSVINDNKHIDNALSNSDSQFTNSLYKESNLYKEIEQKISTIKVQYINMNQPRTIVGYDSISGTDYSSGNFKNLKAPNGYSIRRPIYKVISNNSDPTINIQVVNNVSVKLNYILSNIPRGYDGSTSFSSSTVSVPYYGSVSIASNDISTPSNYHAINNVNISPSPSYNILIAPNNEDINITYNDKDTNGSIIENNTDKGSSISSNVSIPYDTSANVTSLFSIPSGYSYVDGKESYEATGNTNQKVSLDIGGVTQSSNVSVTINKSNGSTPTGSSTSNSLVSGPTGTQYSINPSTPTGYNIEGHPNNTGIFEPNNKISVPSMTFTYNAKEGQPVYIKYINQNGKVLNENGSINNSLNASTTYITGNTDSHGKISDKVNVPTGYQLDSNYHNQPTSYTITAEEQNPISIHVIGKKVNYTGNINLHFKSGNYDIKDISVPYSVDGNVGDQITLFNPSNYLDKNIQGFDTHNFALADSNENAYSFVIPSTDALGSPINHNYDLNFNSQNVIDHINYKYNSHQIGLSQQFSGANDTPFNVISSNAHIPASYHLVSTSNQFDYDGGTHDVAITPNQVTDTINYQYNGQTEGSHPFTGNDHRTLNAPKLNVNSSNDTNIPAGYKLVNNDNRFNYDGGTYDVAITPNQVTDTIDYQYNGQTEGSHQFKGNDHRTQNALKLDVNSSNDTNIPAGYKLVNNDNQFDYDGGTHNVAITPNQVTDTINYQYNDQTKGSYTTKGNDINAQGASDTSFLIDSTNEPNIPSGYKLKNNTNSVDYDGGTHSVSVMPIQQTDTINYMNGTTQVGQTTLSGDDSATGLASSRFTVGNNPKGLPSYYRVSNPSQRVEYDGQTHTVDVTPESVNQTVKFMYNGNPISSDPNVNEATVSGTYNTHEVVPNDKVPTGWNLANDGSQKITFNADSTPEDVAVTPKQLTDTIKYMANGQLKNTQQFKGNVVQTGINDQLTANTLSEGLPNNYEFVTTPASLNYNGGTHTVQIKLNPADKDTDHIRYVVADNKSQQNNQSINGGTPMVSGYRGQNTTVTNSMVPSGYQLANDGTQNIHFGNRSVTNQVDVVPKSVTDYVKFINSNDSQQLGTVIPKHGLYGDVISNLTAPAHYTLTDPSQVAGMKFTGQSVPRDVYVTPNHENDVVAYVYNNNNIETNHVSGVYGSKQFINAPSNWKLANGVSSQITLNEPVIRVDVVPNVPKVPATNSSLINGLLNVAKDVNGNSINSYRNLVHIMQPNTLHDVSHKGVEIGTTSDRASNNTLLGYVNGACDSIINIANNASTDMKLNGLANKLRTAQSLMQQNEGLLNSAESILPELSASAKATPVDNAGRHVFNLSYVGDRLSNPGGAAHTLLEGLLHADINPLGMGVNTLNTILNNASTSSHYQNVINDLGELVPSQHALQQSRILNDIAQNVQAIANDPSMRNISNLDPARSGKAVSTLQNSVPSIVQASQNYLSPKYNDTDVINYQNNGNTVNSVTKTGLDGSQITGVSAPADYIIATDPGNLMFVKAGNYNVAVKPVQKTDTINYRYSGHILTKQFTGSVLDKLVINNVPEGGPTDYHVVGNPEFNYDGLTHDVSLQRNAAGYSNDNVDYVVNDSNSQNNGRVLAYATMYGQNGTSAQVPADRVPAGYHLANDSTDRITFSNASAPHRADIQPDSNETDVIKYIYNDHAVGSKVIENGVYGNVTSVTAPAHYSFVNNGDITIDNGHHDVQVTPNNVTETVNFVDNHGHAVGSAHVNGAYGTTVNVSSDVPTNYTLSPSASAEVPLDDQSHSLEVSQVPQPSDNTDDSGTNPGGDSVPTPSTPSVPLSPVGPSSMTPQSSASSSVSSEPAQSSYVAPTSYQPSDYVAPSASATPKKRSKANVISIPSIDHHPYVKVGKRDVRVNPKAIKHARVLGAVQRGRKVAYRIKVGKVTGYVYGTAKRIPKAALMNGHKRAYVHIGRKTFKLTAKNLKHVQILKTVQKGRHVKFYVKIRRKRGYVYAKVSVNKYKFNVAKTYNTGYYHVLPKRQHYVKVITPICIYRSYHLSDRARRGRISSGITVRVKRIIRNNGITRFELANGNFITANKGFVKIV